MDAKTLSMLIKVMLMNHEDLVRLKRHLGIDTYTSFEDQQTLDDLWNIAVDLDREDDNGDMVSIL